MIVWPALFLGVGVGLVSSFLGLGGGVLMVPLLPEFFELNQKQVIATSLMTIFLVVLINTLGFSFKKTVNWKVTLLVGPLAAVAAFVAGMKAQAINERTLQIFLILIISYLLFKLLAQIVLKLQPKQSSKVKVAGLGALAGAVSGFTGLGAGAIVAPSLLGFKEVKNIQASPTTNAIMVFTTLFAALSFVYSDYAKQTDYIQWNIVIVLFVGAFVSSYFGRKFQSLLPATSRKVIFLVILSLLLIKQVYRIL